MLPVLHSTMGEGLSCSTSLWQVYPLTAGVSFPVCTTLKIGWAKSSESWETLNAISRNSTARQKAQVPMFSPLLCLTVQWDVYVVLPFRMLGKALWIFTTSGVKEEVKRNAQPVSDWFTRSTKSHVSLHSWILPIVPGVPLQIRGKWSAKKRKHCLPSCKHHQELQCCPGFMTSVLTVLQESMLAFSFWPLSGEISTTFMSFLTQKLK